MGHPSPSIALLSNPNSGTLSGKDSAAYLDTLCQAYEGEIIGRWDLDADPDGAIERARDSGAEAIVVAGGDGTARSVAQALYHKHSDAALVTLPLGTANMLPKRLYGERSPETIMRELADYQRHPLQVGCIEDHVFMIAACIGFPSVFGWAREALRPGARQKPISDGWRRVQLALRHMFSSRLRYQGMIDGDDIKGKASGMFIAIPPHETVGTQIIFPKALDCYAFRFRDWMDVASLSLETLTLQSLPSERATRFESHDLALRSRKPIAVMLDGEPCYMDRELKLQWMERPLITLAPTP